MKFIPFVFLTVLIISCDQDVALISNPKSELSFRYKKVNSDNDAVYEVHTNSVVDRRAVWSYYYDQYWLSQSIYFEVEPEDGEAFEVGLFLRKGETNESILTLEDDSLNPVKRKWNYKIFEDEVVHFYKDFDGRFEINYKAMFSSDLSNFMKAVKTQKVLVDGVEKTYVEIHFQGEAFGYYDPYKAYEGYIIQEGIFRGVIEQ